LVLGVAAPPQIVRREELNERLARRVMRGQEVRTPRELWCYHCLLEWVLWKTWGKIPTQL